MKKQLLAAAAMIVSLAVSAQLVEINSMQRVELPEGMTVGASTLSPDGSFIVVSDAGSGLTKISLDGSAPVCITTNGSASGVTISADGKHVVYRQSTIGKDKLRYTSLNSVDLSTGKEMQLVKPSRNLNAGVAMVDNTVTAVEKGKTKVSKLAGKVSTPAAVVSINYGHLDYTVGNKTVTLDPQGRGSYLWPALSPDGSKIVYYLAGRGCFVCNTDGSDVRALGLLRAAKWLDNNMVVGMRDADNGEFTTESTIIVADLNGTRQALTEAAQIAMYPTASADGKHIAFNTADGELFIINLK